MRDYDLGRRDALSAALSELKEFKGELNALTSVSTVLLEDAVSIDKLVEATNQATIDVAIMTVESLLEEVK